MPVTIYNVAKLYWTARNGSSEMRPGNAAIMAKRLETLRCPARLVLLDGTKIGGCEHISEPGKLKWAWWYDKDALISHTEPTRHEAAIAELEAKGILLKPERLAAAVTPIEGI